MVKKENLSEVRLYDDQSERILLAVLLQDPKFIVNLDKWEIKPQAFYFSVHQTIYSVIISVYNEKGLVDPFIVASKLKSFGVTSYNDVSILEYLEILLAIPVVEDSYADYLEEVLTLYYLREADKKHEGARKDLRRKKGENLSQILSFIEKTSEDISTIKVSNSDDEFKDLFGTLEESIKGIADSGELPGLYSPFKTFNARHGVFKFGGSYVFAAQGKVGKSTFLLNMAEFFAMEGKGKTKVLIFDTELSTIENQTRLMASESGVKENHYVEGSFKNNPSEVAKAEKVFEKYRDVKGLIYHIYAPEKKIEDVESMAKRFYTRHVKEGENFVVIYDYIKITGENTIDQQEWAIIHNKSNRLKKLAASLPRTIVLTSVQLDDENRTAMSRRIIWESSGVWLLKKKTPDEQFKHGEKFGTHILEEKVTRGQGDDYQEFCQATVGKEMTWIKNNLFFDFSNFKVKESGTTEDMLREQTGQQLTPRKERSKGWSHEDLT